MTQRTTDLAYVHRLITIVDQARRPRFDKFNSEPLKTSKRAIVGY